MRELIRRIPDKWAYFLLAVYVLVIAIFMSTRISNIAGGADPSSYMELARMFGKGEVHTEMREIGSFPLETFDKGLYESIGLRQKRDSYQQEPTAFTGYPLLIAGLDLLLSEENSVWMSVFLCDIVLLFSLFALMRNLNVNPYWSLFAVGTLGLSPLFVMIGSLPMTDMLTAILAMLSWLFARNAHLSKRYAVLLGLTLGYAVLVRSTNVLFFIPVLISLSFMWRNQRWWLIMLSGMPVFIFWICFNYFVYGSFFSNGYGEVSGLFGSEHFVPSMVHYGKSLWMLLFPSVIILFPFSLFLLRDKKRELCVAWTWIIVIFCFYAFYYASYENWWILRYTLAAWPALMYCSILGVTEIVRRLKVDRFTKFGPQLVALLFFFSAVGYGAYQTKKTKAYEFLLHEGPIITGVNWINENTNEKDVFLCFQSSGSLFYYTKRSIVRFERLSQENWEMIKADATKNEYSIYGYFHLFEYDQADKIGPAFEGEWELAANVWPFNIFKLTD